MAAKKNINSKGQEMVVLERVATGDTVETGDLATVNSLLADGHRVKKASPEVRQVLADAGAPVERGKAAPGAKSDS